jgi:hypothetical protein
MSAAATAFGVDVVWSSVSLFQVAEGVTAVALLGLLAVVVESSGFGSLFDSPVLRAHLRSPFSYLFAFLGVLGVLSFLLLGLCGMRRVCEAIDVNGWNIVQYPLGFLGQVGGAAFGAGGRMGYGALALATWGATVLFLSLAGGLAKALKLFALPSLLFLTAAVLVFDPGEMSSQAVNLASDVTFDGMSLLSNWFLFTVSLFFIAFGLVYERSGGSKRTRSASLRRQARE